MPCEQNIVDMLSLCNLQLTFMLCEQGLATSRTYMPSVLFKKDVSEIHTFIDTTLSSSHKLSCEASTLAPQITALGVITAGANIAAGNGSFPTGLQFRFTPTTLPTVISLHSGSMSTVT